jgi:hypothetical protein
VAMAEIVSGLQRRAARRAVTRGSIGQWRRPEADVQNAAQFAKTGRLRPPRLAAGRDSERQFRTTIVDSEIAGGNLGI